MYQDFDASEFDYLSTTTPQQFEQQNQQNQPTNPEASNIERFWTLTGNWGEFGLYFGAGLSASLIVRAIPVLIPSAVILFPAIGLGVGLVSLTADSAVKLRIRLIFLAVSTALVAGNWDAWTAWIVANSQLLILTGSALIVAVGLVITGIKGGFSHE